MEKKKKILNAKGNDITEKKKTENIKSSESLAKTGTFEGTIKYCINVNINKGVFNFESSDQLTKEDQCFMLLKIKETIQNVINTNDRLDKQQQMDKTLRAKFLSARYILNQMAQQSVNDIHLKSQEEAKRRIDEQNKKLKKKEDNKKEKK